MRIEHDIKTDDNVILGAGLTGLSAAYHGGGVIYEKEKEIGGTCRSSRSHGYIFDLGIHVLHSKNSYVLNLLAKASNLNLRLKKRSAWIYSHGVFTKYPFQANTFGLSNNIIMECLNGFIDTLRKPYRHYANYEDWVYATFGNGIADNFYIPYSEKFWTVKIRELTTDWLDARVPRPRLEHVVRGAISLQKKEFGPNTLFQYPKHGGIQQLASALLNKKTKVVLSKEAKRIDLCRKMVYFSDNTAIHYRNLISTIPLPELFNMIDRIPVPVKDAVKELKYNSILCINLGVKRENIHAAHWIYFPEEKYAAFRISFPGNFSKFVVPKQWSSIQAEVSFSKFRPLKHKDMIGKVINDLLRAGIIKPRDRIRLINMKEIKYAYVIYYHLRLKNLQTISGFLKRHNIYNAGRYGKWEYFWMDDAIINGKKTMEEIKKQ